MHGASGLEFIPVAIAPQDADGRNAIRPRALHVLTPVANHQASVRAQFVTQQHMGDHVGLPAHGPAGLGAVHAHEQIDEPNVLQDLLGEDRPFRGGDVELRPQGQELVQRGREPWIDRRLEVASRSIVVAIGEHGLGHPVVSEPAQ